MGREDLTGYADAELELRFANDEGLYQGRYETWVEVIERAQQEFIFNDAQLDDLKEWWDDYQEEDE